MLPWQTIVVTRRWRQTSDCHLYLHARVCLLKKTTHAYLWHLKTNIYHYVILVIENQSLGNYKCPTSSHHFILQTIPKDWYNHSEIDFCKVDIFIAGLAHIDIERCHRAWQGEDLCWQGSETRSWYATSNKQFAFSATSATVLLPLIFAYPTMQEAAVPPLIRRSSPVKLLSRPSAGVSPREAARKKKVSSILDLGVNNESISRLDPCKHPLIEGNLGRWSSWSLSICPHDHRPLLFFSSYLLPTRFILCGF